MGTTNDHSEEGVQEAAGQHQAEGQQASSGQDFDSGPEEDSEDDPVVAALQYDFFSDESDKGDKTSQSEGGEQDSAQPGERESAEAGRKKEGEQAGQEDGQQGREQASSGPSETDQLKAQMAELQRQNQMLMQSIQQGGQQGQGQGEQSQAQGQDSQSGRHDPQAEQQRLAGEYNFQLDPQMMQMIRSDDDNEAAQGIQRLVQGIGMAVHQKVLNEARQGWQSHVQSQVPHLMAMQQGQRQQTDNVRKDFYGTFPQYDKPGMHQLVLQTAHEVAQEKGAQQWTPELRDAVGARMAQKLQAWGVGQGQQPAAQGPGTPVPRKPSFDTGGAPPRGPAAPTSDNSSRDIAGTLFG